MDKTATLALQKRLNDALAPHFPISTDGGLGKQTKGAIAFFQSLMGLPVTGELDAETIKLLTPQTTQAQKPAVFVGTKGNSGKQLYTSTRALKDFGQPGIASTQPLYMESWEVPDDIEAAFSHVKFAAMGTIGFPKKIFIAKKFRPELEKALRNVINRGLAHEMKVWDGCYMLRKKVSNSGSYSMHAWGLAVDINAAENGYNKPVKLSEAFIQCFTDCHIISGAYWNPKDGMHFELAG